MNYLNYKERLMKLTIIRGLPGSGKSTLANKMKFDDWQNNKIASHLEADSFHMINGIYTYKPVLARYSHLFCESLTAYYMNRGYNVFVANTFITKSTVIPYYELSLIMNSEFEIINCTGEYNNIYNVPDNVLVGMKERFEDFTTESFVSYFNDFNGDNDYDLES